MGFIKYSLLIVLLLGATACSTVDVSTDYDKNSDFSAIKTYQWIPNEKNKAQMLRHGRITESIENQLKHQGYQLVAEGGDLKLNYSVLTEDKVDIKNYNTYSGYAPGFGYGAGYYGYRGMTYGARMSHNETVIKEYKNGTLIIDFIDPKSNELVWRGLGSKKLPETASSDTRDDLVAEVVESILTNFPPK